MDRPRVEVAERFEPALGHRERVVGEVPAAGRLVALVHREVDHPHEGQHPGVGEAEVAPEAPAVLAEHGGDRVAPTDHDEDRVGALGPDGGNGDPELVVGQAAREWSLGALRVELDPGADRSGGLGVLGEAVEPLAGPGRTTRHP
jgi:hypothetical protein